MIPKFKDRISFHGLFLQAAKRRILDEPHVKYNDKVLMSRASSLLQRTEEMRARIHISARPIKSGIESVFLKDFKYYLSLMNIQATRLEELVRSDSKDSFSTLHEMQRELISLDAEVEEKEIELLGNYSKVYLNTFNRPTDGQLQWTDQSWLVDFKTSLSFMERYLMDIIPSAGATLPIKGYNKAPIVDAVVIDEKSDVGDSVTPYIISNPRNVFRRNKIFKYVVARQEFDTSSRRYKSKTSYDSFPHNCVSTMTLQVELANVMHINTLKIHPLGDSTLSIKSIHYINEAGEEISLNTIPIDNHTEIVVLFEPVFTKYIIIQFEQYSHLAKTSIDTGDKRAKAINRILNSVGFTANLPYISKTIQGRVYDFSLRSIEVGLSAYENKGIFRGLPVDISSPVGMEVSKVIESIAPTIKLGSYTDLVTLPEGNVVQEAYVGVRLFDKDGNRRVDNICPVLDTGLVQLEYLSPVSEICRYKLFPDLKWALEEICIDSMEIVELCDEWIATTQSFESIADQGYIEESNSWAFDTVLDGDSTGDTSHDVSIISKGSGASWLDLYEVLPESNNSIGVTKIFTDIYGKFWPNSKQEKLFKGPKTDINLGISISTGSIDGRTIDLDLLKVFNSNIAVTRAGSMKVEIEYVVSDAVLRQFYGTSVYNNLSVESRAAIKNNPILYMGIGGKVFGGGKASYAYAEAKKLYKEDIILRPVGRTYIKFRKIQTENLSLGKEVFKFEITLMNQKPRVKQKVRIARADELNLDMAENLRVHRANVGGRFLSAKKGKSGGAKNLRIASYKMRNELLKVRWGYHFDTKSKSIKRVRNDDGTYWSTPILARRAKGSLNLKLKQDPSPVSGSINPLSSKTNFVELNRFSKFTGMGFLNLSVISKEDDYGIQQSILGDRSDLVTSPDECTTTNEYIRISSAKPHGLAVGDTIVFDTPKNTSTDGLTFTVSIIEDDFTYYILRSGNEDAYTLYSYFITSSTPRVCFYGENSSSRLIEVYKNNVLLTIGSDYEISMDDGSTWYSDWPAIAVLVKDFYRNAGAGRFYIKLLDYDRSKVYWTKYFVKRNQYLTSCKQIYLRNGRVVFDENLRYTSGTLQPILINRTNSAHPYITSVTTEYTLAMQSRGIQNNPTANIRRERITSYLSGDSLNVT